MSNTRHVLIATVSFVALGCSIDNSSATVTTAPPRPSASPVSASSLALPELGSVRVRVEPYCGEAGELQGSTERTAWLKKPAVQQAVFSVAEAMEAFTVSQIGVVPDEREERIVIVMHTDFEAFGVVQRALAAKVRSVQVLLTKGCHSRREIEDAKRVLLDQTWHAKAKATPMGFSLDTAFSGYDVVIDESAPDVAEALRERLGALVHVTMGQPRRH